MTPLGQELTTDELVLANEITRAALILTDGRSLGRRSVIMTYAAAQLVGVTMASGSAPRRDIDSQRLDEFTSRMFTEGKARAFIHGMAQAVTAKTAETVLAEMGTFAALTLPKPAPDVAPPRPMK